MQDQFDYHLEIHKEKLNYIRANEAFLNELNYASELLIIDGMIKTYLELENTALAEQTFVDLIEYINSLPVDKPIIKIHKSKESLITGMHYEFGDALYNKNELTKAREKYLFVLNAYEKILLEQDKQPVSNNKYAKINNKSMLNRIKSSLALLEHKDGNYQKSYDYLNNQLNEGLNHLILMNDLEHKLFEGDKMHYSIDREIVDHNEIHFRSEGFLDEPGKFYREITKTELEHGHIERARKAYTMDYNTLGPFCKNADDKFKIDTEFLRERYSWRQTCTYYISSLKNLINFEKKHDNLEIIEKYEIEIDEINKLISDYEKKNPDLKPLEINDYFN